MPLWIFKRLVKVIKRRRKWRRGWIPDGTMGGWSLPIPRGIVFSNHFQKPFPLFKGGEFVFGVELKMIRNETTKSSPQSQGSALPRRQWTNLNKKVISEPWGRNHQKKEVTPQKNYSFHRVIPISMRDIPIPDTPPLNLAPGQPGLKSPIVRRTL